MTIAVFPLREGNIPRPLTRSFLGSYFSHRAYYALNASSEVDNPDQRMAEDINTFTQKSLFFLLVLVGALLQLVAFRFSLVRVRENAEAIVFYRGEAQESGLLDQHFDEVFESSRKLIWAQLKLNFSSMPTVS